MQKYKKTLNRHEKDIDELKTALSEQRTKLENQEKQFLEHLNRHILDDLQETRYGGKFLYSYEDIANRHDVSTSYVQRLAADNGLSRRKKVV